MGGSAVRSAVLLPFFGLLPIDGMYKIEYDINKQWFIYNKQLLDILIKEKEITGWQK